jgi:hypothetical protein
MITAFAVSAPLLWPGRTAGAGLAAAEKINLSAAVRDPKTLLLWYGARVPTIEVNA